MHIRSSLRKHGSSNRITGLLATRQSNDLFFDNIFISARKYTRVWKKRDLFNDSLVTISVKWDVGIVPSIELPKQVCVIQKLPDDNAPILVAISNTALSLDCTAKTLQLLSRPWRIVVFPPQTLPEMHNLSAPSATIFRFE